MLLHLTLLRSSLNQPRTPQIELDIDNRITLLFCLVDDILSSVPWMLRISATGTEDPISESDIESVHGTMLVWPLISLNNAFRVPEIRERDQSNRADWVRSVLTFLTHDMSISKVHAWMLGQQSSSGSNAVVAKVVPMLRDASYRAS